MSSEPIYFDEQQFETLNNTEPFEDENLDILFERVVEKFPDRIALRFENKILTYKELNNLANQLANSLSTQNLKSNSIIGICLEPSFDLFVAILATLKLNCAYLPLDNNYPSERLNYMLEDANASLLLTHSEIQSQFKNIINNIICVDKIEKHKSQHTKTSEKNLLAYIIYTSGSTGKPKGVVINQQNVNHFNHWFKKATQVTEFDVFDFSSSISFDFTIPMTVFPLLHGASIAICSNQDKKDPKKYLAHVNNHHVSIIKLTPSYFRELKEVIDPKEVFPYLRLIVFGGESLYAKDLIGWFTQFPKQVIINEYGPTEATVASTWLQVEPNDVEKYPHFIPIGKPAANTEIYILNENLGQVSKDEIGEIYIGGTGIANEYLNKPKETAEKFIKNPFKPGRLYRTGDLARYLSDGNIEFVGRVDHQIKVRGFRVELNEIEICLEKHPHIKQVLVLPENNSQFLGENKLIAYCMIENDEPSVSELRNYLSKQLPDYMIPANFIFVKNFPLTINGKIDVKALRSQHPSIKKINDSMTELETLLATLWMDLLEVNQVDKKDNFFELGGHSLLAVRAINRIRNVIHKNIELAEFYENPTIESMVKLLNQKKEETKSEKSEQDKIRLTKYPLNDLQLLFWIMQNLSSDLKLPNVIIRKRLNGKVQFNRLRKAVRAVLDKHQILTYYISSVYPIQYPHKIKHLNIYETDIKNLPNNEQQSILESSLQELEHNTKWKKNYPLLYVRIFYLENNESELQIAIPHIISDEITPTIILNDLNNFYLKSLEAKSAEQTPQFVDQILLEKKYEKTLLRDELFWNQYLANSLALNFSEDKLTSSHSTETVYYPIPSELIENLKMFSIKNNLTPTDILLGATALVLRPFTHNNLMINFVRSTRMNDLHENTPGLFIRNDILKINVQKPELVSIANNARASRLMTEPYQTCPGIIKLAAFYKHKNKNHFVARSIIHLIANVLSFVFKDSKLHPLVLKKYGEIFVAKRDDFILNVNILNSFFSKKHKETLFGLDILKNENLNTNKMAAKNVIDICFSRNEENQPQLLISGNLKPDFKLQIAKEIIHTLSLNS